MNDASNTKEPESRRLTGAAGLAAALRREIVDGTLLFRDALPSERRLSELHGVSRGTVREALAMLEREKLVETRRGSGTYVVYGEDPAPRSTLFEAARPLELIDARFALEPHICRLAVLHATGADLERAEDLLRIMETCTSDPVAFSIADVRFHTLLAESTTNPLLLWMVSQLNDVRNRDQWAQMRTMTLNPETIMVYNAQHRQVVEAIRDRRPEQAAEAMKRHLEAARLSLTRAAQT